MSSFADDLAEVKKGSFADDLNSLDSAPDITDEDLQFERNQRAQAAEDQRSGYNRVRVGRGGSLPDPEKSAKAAPWIAGALPFAAAIPEIVTMGPLAAGIGLGRSMLGSAAGGLLGAGAGYTTDRMGITKGYGEPIMGTLGALYGGARPAQVGAATEKLSMGRFTGLAKVLGSKLKGQTLEEIADAALVKDLTAQGFKDAPELVKAAEKSPQARQILENVARPKVSSAPPPFEISPVAGGPVSQPRPESIAAMEARRAELAGQADAQVRAQRLAARRAQGEANAAASEALRNAPREAPGITPVQEPVGRAARVAPEITRTAPPRSKSEAIMRLSQLYKSDQKSRDAVREAAKQIFTDPDEYREAMRLIKSGNSGPVTRFY